MGRESVSVREKLERERGLGVLIGGLSRWVHSKSVGDVSRDLEKKREKKRIKNVLI